MATLDDNNHNGQPLRGAIVGFGNAAIHAHLPAWQTSERFTIEAVVEPVAERAAAVSRFLPDARLYSSIEELLAGNPRLDFIDICTPPCHHVELALGACHSGLHVFCEKPLAASMESFLQIQQTAAESDQVVFTVNNWKYAPLWLTTAELVHNGEIGPVHSICLNVLRPPNSGGGASDWRKCRELSWGGILIDHGWHNLYVVLTLMQKQPLVVSAKMESPNGLGPCCEETVDLTVLFSEAEARLHLTWRASCRRNFGVIRGERGVIQVNDDHLILERQNRAPLRYDFPEALSAGSHHPEWMKPVIDNFHEEINRIQERGLNLTEARWCTQLIEAAYRSNREASRPIEILKTEAVAFPSCAAATALKQLPGR
ncbi:MAG: Gfo/Idh/MocA family oxidoreductase [Desulforhabdus sp.]|jgi:predicted dehydrogenase|nr:Gfo/Idh/MocA family oxidoreductase [Desulforhabdus sp.]